MKKLLVATLIASVAAGAAYAGDAHAGKKHNRPDMFKLIDTNGDGAISKAESQAFSDKKFAERDTNGDGKITQAEHDEMKAKRKAAWEAKKAASVNKDAPAAKE